MRNKIASNGAAMTFDNASDTAIPGGAVVVLDEGGTPFCGIATSDIAPGEMGIVDTAGVYALPKGNVALAAHSAAHWDKATGTVAAAGVYLGRVCDAAAEGSKEVLVRLNFGPIPAQVTA